MWKSPPRDMARDSNKRRRVALLVNSTNGYYELPSQAPPDALAEVDAADDCSLPVPRFRRPKHEGTGMGIENDSVVINAKQLRSQLAKVMHKHRQPALVESYIEGRELTCGVVGNNGDLRVLPILEVDFAGYPADLLPVYSSVHKNELDHLYRYECPARLPDTLARQVRRLPRETV